MNQSCKKCGTGFEIEDEDLKFYKKIDVPSPKLCPICRMQRRMAFRKERNLYKRKCDFSGKEILAVYQPDCGFPVYDQKIWWSDKWDPLDYGRDFDFNKSFFEQFGELLKVVPRINLQNRNNENSDYCNDTNDLKDCYLSFNAEHAQNYYYVNTGGYGSDSVDCFWLWMGQLCYECAKVDNAYHCFWCFNCSNVSDCYFCENLIGCKNCFGCSELRQKQYCIYNKQVSREEYEDFFKTFEFSYEKIEDAKSELSKLHLKIPHKNLHITNSENCLGDFILNSKNCRECFDVSESENCKYVWDALLLNSYDCFNVGLDSAFLYDCVGVYRSNNMRFCDKCSMSHDLTYCDYCFSCNDCFGCVGLRHKKYCILNKQYEKEEYEILISKIFDFIKQKGEYGEYFSPILSPYGYNDSMAQWYFPLSKEEALQQGFKWSEYTAPALDLKALLAKDLPNKIEDVSDDILAAAIKCERDGKLFRIIPQELEFYRKHKIALPHLCPDCRHVRRKKMTNPRNLRDESCANCGIAVKTTYPLGHLERIYCEKCYLKELY